MNSLLVPRNVGERHFQIQGATGLDWFLLQFAPVRFQIWYFGRKVAQIVHPVGRPGVDTFSLPGAGVFEILDTAGHVVRPFTPAPRS